MGSTISPDEDVRSATCPFEMKGLPVRYHSSSCLRSIRTHARRSCHADRASITAKRASAATSCSARRSKRMAFADAKARRSATGLASIAASSKAASMARGGPWRATRSAASCASMSFAIVVLSLTVDAKRARDAARRLMSLHKLPRGFRRFPARGQYTSGGSPPTALGARCLNICKPVVGELGKEAHSIATGSASRTYPRGTT